MANNSSTTRWQRAGRWLIWSLVLVAPFGCSRARYTSQQIHAARVLPPVPLDAPPDTPARQKLARDTSGVTQAQFEQPSDDAVDLQAAASAAPPQESAVGETAQTFTLAQAIDTAFQHQPRLRVFLEGIEQARRGEDLAFVPFLPLAVAGYSVGTFDLNVGGHSTPLGPLPGFTFLPSLGSIPIWLNINSGYELADLKLLLLICNLW